MAAALADALRGFTDNRGAQAIALSRADLAKIATAS
jgi:hypothetical protein